MKTNLTRQAEKCLWYETNRMGVFGCFEVTIGWLGNERVEKSDITQFTSGSFSFGLS